jgi:nicotinamidase-related amidase
MTSIGVESTARSGRNYGYNMVFITDAMDDFDQDAHNHTVEKIFPRLGERAATDEVLKRVLIARAGTPARASSRRGQGYGIAIAEG